MILSRLQKSRRVLGSIRLDGFSGFKLKEVFAWSKRSKEVEYSALRDSLFTNQLPVMEVYNHGLVAWVLSMAMASIEIADT